MKLIMCKGLPGSGKSTWAKQLCDGNPTWVRVNKDSLRAMISSYNLKKENFVVKLRDAFIRTAMQDKRNVIVDDTNLDPKHEFNLRKIANEFGAEFEVKSFLDVPMATCIKQDLKRQHSVGEKVIKNMYRQYLAPKPAEAPAWNPNLPEAIICDIDGTLAIHLERGPYDMEKCETDGFDETVLKLIVDAHEEGTEIIFCTGREEKYREATVRWLKKRLASHFADLLFMRKTDDHREDSIIKQEIYDAEIKGKYNVEFVLDDRNRVVEMWRRNGLKCLQVAEGDF